MGTKKVVCNYVSENTEENHIYILLYFPKKMKNMLQENQPWRINDAQSTMVKKANM
jgi:hypothetical protein